MNSAPAPPISRRPPPPALIPPFRYAIVEDGVLRGAHPTLKNYRFLRRLRLRTVVSLMADPPTRDLAEFCAAEDIDLVYHRVQKYDDAEVLSVTNLLVAQVLAVLLDPARYPVFIHCRDGGHNTGLVIMCLRKLQHWTNEFIYEEHRRYTKLNEIHYQEMRFTESFSGPVCLPVEIPVWLWGGTRIRGHPSIRLSDSEAQKLQKEKEHQMKQEQSLLNDQPGTLAQIQRLHARQSQWGGHRESPNPLRLQLPDDRVSLDGAVSRATPASDAQGDGYVPGTPADLQFTAVPSGGDRSSARFASSAATKLVSSRASVPHAGMHAGDAFTRLNWAASGSAHILSNTYLGDNNDSNDGHDDIVWPESEPSPSQALDYLDLAPRVTSRKAPPVRLRNVPPD